MANYNATARSNYFAVKDEKAFREWAAHIGLNILEPCHHDQIADGISRFGIAPGDDEDCGSWPTYVANEETEEFEDIDLHEQLAAHLAEGEVAVLMEAGSEKLRHVTGIAVAVNHKGERARVDLNSIYDAARHLGPNITRAEY